MGALTRERNLYARPAVAPRLPGSEVRRIERVGEVDPALDLPRLGPAARPWVLARLDGPGAGERVAPDRQVALLPQRVVRQVVLLHVGVHFPAAPVQERRDRVAVVARGPLYEPRRLAGLGLLAADATEPRRGGQLLHRPLHRLVLVGGAAGVHVLAPRRVALAVGLE